MASVNVTVLHISTVLNPGSFGVRAIVSALFISWFKCVLNSGVSKLFFLETRKI
jgi:hypothetical protein